MLLKKCALNLRPRWDRDKGPSVTLCSCLVWKELGRPNISKTNVSGLRSVAQRYTDNPVEDEVIVIPGVLD